jgi:SAM-dependent methyltransferase
MSRNDKVLCSINRSMRILELGALTNPIAPKSGGWLTTVVDHLSREQLVEKYRDDPGVDTSHIGEVDIVWSNGALEAAVPRELHGAFDAFIASHVFEHIPDPIGLLRSLEQVLRPTGVVSLVIPDKRFSFDFFRPLSTVGGLLDAHATGAIRHSRNALFDQLAYAIRADGEIAFSRRRLRDIDFVHPLQQAKYVFDTLGVGEDAPYVDAHGWVFTPSSFALAMLELSALNAIDFTTVRSFPSEGCEFYVTLRRGRVDHSDTDALQARRLNLQRRTLEELREQVEMLDEWLALPTAEGSEATQPDVDPAPDLETRTRPQGAWSIPLGSPAREIPLRPTAIAVPTPIANDSLVARVVAAYKFAIDRSEASGSFWDTQFADLKADVHAALINGDSEQVQLILADPGSTDLFYGFDNLARSLIATDGRLITDEDLFGTAIYRDLLLLSEAIGVRALWNPENPREQTFADVETILAKLDGTFGFTITFPNPFPGEVGLETTRGIASYRAVQALYQAWRIAGLLSELPRARILEIGAGMGRTAFYASQLGISNYTIIDLPMTNVAQAAFLSHALGDDQITLAGEERPGSVRVLPPFAFLEASDEYDLVLNVDSMTEMSREIAQSYCRAVKDRARMFLSINHETYTLTVANTAASVGIAPATRTPYWMRTGYVDELFILRDTTEGASSGK